MLSIKILIFLSFIAAFTLISTATLTNISTSICMATFTIASIIAFSNVPGTLSREHHQRLGEQSTTNSFGNNRLLDSLTARESA